MAGELIVDEVILICNGCHSERCFPQNPHLRGAREIKRWLDTQATRCPKCNASTCDVKMRLVEPS